MNIYDNAHGIMADVYKITGESIAEGMDVFAES